MNENSPRTEPEARTEPDQVAPAERSRSGRRRPPADETPQEQARRKAQNRRDRQSRRNRREPLLRAGIAILGWLPLGLAARIGGLVGGLIYRFSPSVRERLLVQLNVAFGAEKSGAEIDEIARNSVRLMARGVASMPTLARMGPERFLERVEVENEHYMQEALAVGKGVIVVTFHYGLMDAGATWLSHHFNCVVLSTDAGDQGALRLLIELRKKLGGATLERGETRALVRTLRENRPVAMVADHDVQSLNGVFVPFFGRLAHTPLGPAALAQRLGLSIVPGVAEWTSPTTYRARFLGHLRPRTDLPKDEAAYELTYRYTKLGEDAIRARPDHWMWLHKRWETRPEDRPELPVWEPPPDA